MAGMGRTPIGIGGVVILFVLSLIFGRDLVSPALQQQPPPQVSQEGRQAPPDDTTPQEEAKVDEIGKMLDDMQMTWGKLLGSRYQRAKLVLFRGATESACGMG